MKHWPHLPSETIEFVKQRCRFFGETLDDQTAQAIWKLLPYHRFLASLNRPARPLAAILAEAPPSEPPTPDTPVNPQEC